MIPERAAMGLSRPNRLHDDSHTIVRLPVLLFTLLSIVVPVWQSLEVPLETCKVSPDPIGVLLLKLVNVGVALLGELPSEELEGVLQSKSNAFQKESVLQSRLVLDMVSCC